MSHCSFGNRWYRRIYRDYSQEQECWKERTFSLGDLSLYQPYRRGHGLFRRVAHWSATAMLGALPSPPLGREDTVGIEEYPKGSLPAFVKRESWVVNDGTGMRRGYWARLDFRLAYPSVRLPVLLERLDAMLRGDMFSILLDGAYAGYPPGLSSQLLVEPVRLALARRLVEALAQVTYVEGDYRGLGELWIPSDDEGLPSDLPGIDSAGNPGLPTGLTISGLLLNVYLDPIDRAMQEWYSASGDKVKGAYLRFADDMVLMAQQPTDLLDGLDRLWAAACGDEQARLQNPKAHNPSNLRIHPGKVEPEPLGTIIKAYQQDKRSGRPTLTEWWERLGAAGQTGYLKGVEKTALRREKLGFFVTYLVEQMSVIGSDQVGDRFGSGQRQRLADLHELVRLDIQDQQVRADTRVTFAANKLARAWLPEGEPAEERYHIQSIRESVQEAVLLTPWKFKLWRAVVRAAVRRPHAETDLQQSLVDQLTAQVWLVEMLSYVRDGGVWSLEWPEMDGETDNPADGKWKPYYLSMLRAEFWRAVGETLHDLGRVVEHTRSLRQSPWSAIDWTFRAIPEEQASKLLEWLADFDCWTLALYGKSSELQLFGLEREAFTFASLARIGQSKLSGNVTDWGARVVKPLAIPARLVPGLAQDVDDAPGKSGATWPLLHFARPEYSAKGFIGKRLWDAAKGQSGDRVDVARAMRLVRAEPPIAAIRYWQRRTRVPARRSLGPRQRFERYRSYFLLRRFGLSEPGPFPRWGSEGPTLQRLLWARVPGDPDSEPVPAHAPALGLPTRVCCKMLLDALDAVPASNKLLSEQLLGNWVIREEVLERIFLGRRMQFATEAPEDGPDYLFEQPLISISATDWELPPHPLIVALADNARGFLPAWQRGAWVGANLLHFLVALEGSEAWLDQLFERGPSSVPFEEHWQKRNRIHLPNEVWVVLDRVLRPLLASWSGIDISNNLDSNLASLRGALERVLVGGVSMADFGAERADIRLDPVQPFELCRQVQPVVGGVRTPSVDGPWDLDIDALKETLRVRVAQLKTKADPVDLVAHHLRPSRDMRQRLMAEIAWHLGERTRKVPGKDGDSPVDLVVFPESVLPVVEVREFERMVSAGGKAALIGLLWRRLPSAASSGRSVGGKLVNEATLHIPVGPALGLPLYRTFAVRKPRPAHVEYALAEVLSETTRADWQMLPGRRWYRFLHKTWGDFSVAICADLLDAAPWAMFRGQLLHLFQCAYNKDVELFKSLTWVRAYETYVNVVSTNHGSIGGSFVWTPRSGPHHRTIADLEGAQLSLVADVELPVRDLFRQQLTGAQDALEKGKEVWTAEKEHKPSFKAPPPGYRRVE